MTMKPLLVLALGASAFVLGACKSSTEEPLRTVRFLVTADTIAEGSAIHLSGNHEDLGAWDPGAVHLTLDTSGFWTGSLVFPLGTVLEYKLTLGSWESEAVDEAGLELPNSRLEVRSDTTVRIHVRRWRSLVSGPVIVSPVRFRNKAGMIELLGPWKFHEGDDPRWASPGFDDTGWETRDPRLQAGQHPSQGWGSIGWFRFRLTVDSSLAGAPLGLQVVQMGASEIFLNGEPVLSMGVVSANPAEVSPRRDITPKVITLAREPEQILAVRYANPLSAQLHAAGHDAGFSIILYDNPNAAIDAHNSIIRASTIQQWAFAVIPLVLAFTHFMLFVFYPSNRANLYYALSMIGWSGITYTSFQGYFIADPAEALLVSKLSWASISMALAFGVLTAYARVCDKMPVAPLALAGAALVLVPVGVLTLAPWGPYAYYALIGITAIEMVRALVTARPRESRSEWIVAAGSVVLMTAVIIQVLIGLGVFTQVLGTRVVYIYGVLALSISVSIDLSRSVARSNRDLKRQIVQIKELSSLALEQERRAKEEEVNLRLLEADNRRKTQELEQARALQLSMLPQRLPEIEDIEIAAFMQPATEVGGDYYDFHIGEDGALTLAVGDATGHGARAGTMVTVSKSLFHQLALEADVLTMLKRYNDSIRSLNLGNLYMAMVVARIIGRELSVASAGMPPLLIYRGAQRTVELISLKGMPLGSTLEFPYQQQKIPLYANDLALFMSDGFPELLNDRGQQLEYEQAVSLFGRVASGSPQDVVDAYVAEAKSWASGRPFNDDVTFVALKVRGSDGKAPSA